MRARNLVCLVPYFAIASWAQTISEPASLYRVHRWKELSQSLQRHPGFLLYRGALGVTFDQDTGGAEHLLLSVIKSAPHSSDAYEAYEWLSHLYFYRGQYRKLSSAMEKRWSAFPEKKENAQEQAVIKGFSGLPDQVLEQSHRAQVAHEPGSIFIPLSIEGKQATYFFDTGAWISCMSESEAKRLGLRTRESSGKLGQSAGSQVDFRTTTAADVVIGGTHFKNVSFAIFPDDQEPWSDLPRGRRGIIGIPILVGLRTLSWQKNGRIELAGEPQPFRPAKSNLTFDNDHLVVTGSAENQEIRATVDTGAADTDLYKPFADQFQFLLKQYGKKNSKEVHGVGHAEQFDTITLPELRIQIGGLSTRLSPASVILKSIGASCCIGNFGMDLFRQASTMRIDFGAMRLELVSREDKRARH